MLASLADSPLPQLILLNLQRPLQHLLRLRPPDRDMTRNLLVTPDRKGSDSVASFGRDGGLTSELFEHFGSSGQSVAGFADGDVCASEGGAVGASRASESDDVSEVERAGKQSNPGEQESRTGQ